MCIFRNLCSPRSGAGLGGSGALGVAVTAALDHAFGIERTQAETAAIANAVERQDLGYPGGDQDSFGAALGGILRLEYRVGGGTVPRSVRVRPDLLRAIEHATLLIYTSEAHVCLSLSGGGGGGGGGGGEKKKKKKKKKNKIKKKKKKKKNIHQDILDSYSLPDSPTVAAMQGLKEAAGEMATALETGNLDGYIEALNTSCRELYNLHPSCDSEGHRRMFEALEPHILGGKARGAGGGGFLMAHSPRPSPGRGSRSPRVSGPGSGPSPSTSRRAGPGAQIPFPTRPSHPRDHPGRLTSSRPGQATMSSMTCP